MAPRHSFSLLQSFRDYESVFFAFPFNQRELSHAEFDMRKECGVKMGGSFDVGECRGVRSKVSFKRGFGL